MDRKLMEIARLYLRLIGTNPPSSPFLGGCGGGAFVTHHTPTGGTQAGRKRQPMTVCHGLPKLEGIVYPGTWER